MNLTQFKTEDLEQELERRRKIPLPTRRTVVDLTSLFDYFDIAFSDVEDGLPFPMNFHYHVFRKTANALYHDFFDWYNGHVK